MIKSKNPRTPSAEEIGEAFLVLRDAGAEFVIEGVIEPEFCTVRQVAEILSVKPNWVTGHLAEFPGAVRLEGGDIRIPFADVEAALKRWRVAPRLVTEEGEE